MWPFLTWQPDYIIITINIAVIITAGRLFALTGFGFDYELQNTVFQKMCSENKSSEKRLKKNFGIMKYSSHHQNGHKNIRHGCKNLAKRLAQLCQICANMFTQGTLGARLQQQRLMFHHKTSTADNSSKIGRRH